jgi:hypothetical protein
MSLLTIVHGAAASLGLPQPSTVIGNAHADAVLFLACAQREGKQLARRHDWQALIVQQTWTSTATAAQADAIGSDYDRLVPDVELWDRTTNTLLSGPTPSDSWGRLHSGVTGGVSGWWRLIGGSLYVYPTLVAGHTMAWEYISKNWCLGGGELANVPAEQWSDDTDAGIIPEHLIELGVSWRYLRSKGMDYAEEMSTYEREVEKAASRDRGLRVIGVNTQPSDLTSPFWGGTVQT